MLAGNIMTTNVITVAPDATARDIARLLIENNISAVPVVNGHQDLIGMVSEGDLMGRSEMQRATRRDWWLGLLAEGETLASEFLASLQSPERKAHEIMASPVVTVTAITDISEIARLLTEYNIKRVPVMSDNRIVGIVSRADLVRAFAAQGGQPAPSRHGENLISRAIGSAEKHLHATPQAQETKNGAQPPGSDAKLTAKDFQALAENFKHAGMVKDAEARQKMAERHKQQVQELITHHLDNAHWQSILHQARDAAERGEKECLILRFPNDLCSDGGRAINVCEHGWQETLRGEAAEIYMRWEQDLRLQGFRLSARVLDYPGGFPGDIGLFLVWTQ